MGTIGYECFFFSYAALSLTKKAVYYEKFLSYPKFLY
jgi:hypothetical protein